MPQETIDKVVADPGKPSLAKVMARAEMEAAAVGPVLPRISDETLWLWGRLKEFERLGYLRKNPPDFLKVITDQMRADVLRLAPIVSRFLATLGDQK